MKVDPHVEVFAGDQMPALWEKYDVPLTKDGLKAMYFPNSNKPSYPHVGDFEPRMFTNREECWAHMCAFGSVMGIATFLVKMPDGRFTFILLTSDHWNQVEQALKLFGAEIEDRTTILG